MPAAAGDGLLGEPAAPGSGGGAEEAARPAAACEGSFLPAWVSGVPRERLRDFQHHKRVGNYLIGSRKLGEGSFAKVREGLHVLTGEKVAIKVIDKKRAKKDTYVTKNLRREGQIQQMIRHPNITQLLDILETENSYYLVMELCPGGNLMHKIYEKKRLEESEARRYIRQLISAVEHLHRAGVVHRDLKIENLLLDEDNNIKLIDFGLSNCAGILGYSDPFSTQCGSPAYAAPELLARKKYGPKIDVWSIGVNMYAMLTGTLPFTVEPFSLRALYQKMVDKEMNPLPTQLSTGAINFLRSLLEPDPVKRPNIQQALANRWLNENYTGKVPCNVTYPNRISLEDLSPSVVLHMTEKLGYKNSDVINTVLSNRACHILAIYFLLNKKLERYLSGKSDVQDSVCYKTQLYQIEKCRGPKEPYEFSWSPESRTPPAKDSLWGSLGLAVPGTRRSCVNWWELGTGLIPRRRARGDSMAALPLESEGQREGAKTGWKDLQGRRRSWGKPCPWADASSSETSCGAQDNVVERSFWRVGPAWQGLSHQLPHGRRAESRRAGTCGDPSPAPWPVPTTCDLSCLSEDVSDLACPEASCPPTRPHGSPVLPRDTGQKPEKLAPRLTGLLSLSSAFLSLSPAWSQLCPAPLQSHPLFPGFPDGCPPPSYPHSSQRELSPSAGIMSIMSPPA
ncbi:hypothetical protein GHT09_003206 [Marmota monax]|uniref:Hormonally up-regulated neu tumor-associated kinase n=1 Tax=Marmota monax TaxID=9995 RepID=A0A834QVR9_MARMO|nr:hypothetical protein GHT09_003206 [Marmota monax]